jgi:predicted DNA-binding transcriptional regulator YafY
MKEQGEYVQLGLFEYFSDELSFRKKKQKILKEKLLAKVREEDVVEILCYIDANIEKDIGMCWLAYELDDERNIVTALHSHHLYIRALVYNDPEILLAQLKKYDDKVELIGPPELREQMSQAVKRMYELYFNQGQIRPK